MIESSHCHLKVLSLDNCQLTEVTSDDCLRVEDLGQRLCGMSPCYSLTHLYLDNNSFKGSCIDVLFGFMRLCPNLTVLSSSQCEISSEDFKQLLLKLNEIKQVLPQCLFPLLLSWNLSGNNIDDSGVAAILEHLPSLITCSALGCNINLEDNPTSSEMVTKLNKELEKHQEVSLINQASLCKYFFTCMRMVAKSFCFLVFVYREK